ncbi:uncharacterized protein LOC130760603 [Actinidia eriantha]|uniref:uncharacterized protein LOC130760603 n=1 Tax=Actinidia eriantha TaxID=165200 RepID=UPI002587A5C5|nr:uncharacterized protein LOC130760603 [Actinidia eriantha]
MLKMSVRISHQNNNFSIFILLTSLPLFFTMVLYELILQTTLVQASKILEPPYGYFYNSWPLPFYLIHRLSKDCLFQVDSSEHRLSNAPSPLRALRCHSEYRLSVEAAHGRDTDEFQQDSAEIYQRSKVQRNLYHGYLLVIVFATAFIALLTKYLEWSAMWNMSIVISVLEEVSG